MTRVIDARFLAYLAVMAVLIITPGPDMAMTTRNALRGGRRAAFATGLGVACGSAVWAAAAAAGVAGILAVSATAFTAFKWAGAAYLIALGLRSLLHARTPAPVEPARPGGSAFVQGLTNNLLNPKAAAIFLTVVPQFVEPADPWARLVAMVAVFDIMVVAWLAFFGHLVVTARARLGKSVQQAMQALTGVVLVGLGVRLALERR